MKTNRFILILISFFISFQCLSWAADSGGHGVRMMNSYGENMELEFNLADPGTETIVDYSKYGKFEGLGTENYQYRITDKAGLSAALGEGVYPNNTVYKDPVYKMLMTKGKLAGSQWDYVNIDNQQLSFYKWATANESAGVKQYYVALALEKLGVTAQAIKAYQAVLVHFPKQVSWTYWKTPIYLGRVALDKIEYLTRHHPELGMELVDADISIENGYNAQIMDDKFRINPGRIIKVDPASLAIRRRDLSKVSVVKTVGEGFSQLVQYENHDWQMRVNGKPFIIKGMAYAPTPVGRTTHSIDNYNTNRDWMSSDLDKNGKIDSPYDSWVDLNKNNKQDPNEKVVGDFRLMKEMGVNTLRIYHHSFNKEMLRSLYKDYGIYVIMGDMLGMYAAGSGAEWFEGTDYSNPVHQVNMKQSVRQMVEEYKDEPYVLMWMLGNESNYGEVGNRDRRSGKAGLGSNAKAQPDAHYAFVNEVARMIKSVDPMRRPVGFCNGDTVSIDILSRHCDQIDVFGSNSYRGAQGFGRSFWQDVRKFLDKPVLITEYGCPAYYQGKDAAFGEEKQTEYHRGNWEDILHNSAGYGSGNAIGGVIFEFVDEWWKTGFPPECPASAHDTIGDFYANFPDGWMHEEWLGVVSQGDGSQSPYLRQYRKVYDYYRKVWNES